MSQADDHGYPEPRAALLAQLKELRVRIEALERTVGYRSDVWVAGMAEAARLCVMTLDEGARHAATGAAGPPPTD